MKTINISLFVILFFVNLTISALNFKTEILKDPDFKKLKYEDITIAFSFYGEPGTIKNHSVEGVNQDIICTEISMKEDPTTIGNEQYIFVAISDADLSYQKNWTKIKNAGYDKSKTGTLRVDIYAKHHNSCKYQQIASFQSNESFVAEYSADNTVGFLCKDITAHTLYDKPLFSSLSEKKQNAHLNKTKSNL